nr:LysR family transcriptional regulator [Tsukamurella pseudospumae]
MSDIERLRVVATVAHTHSISEAARVHGVAQSTVTRSVAAAEKLVGFPLFRRGVEGAQLATGARSAITLIERIVGGFDELRTLGGERPAAFRLAHRADVQLPAHLESTMIRWNREHTPHAEEVILDDPIAALLAGEVEIAMVLRSGPGIEDLETHVVKAMRTSRVELVNLPDPPAELAEFLLRV